MSTEPRTTPDNRFVNREADITDLIPGDRVKVVIDRGRRPTWMVYGGHEPVGLNKFTKCTFIDIPEGYKGEDVDLFRVWESYAKYLQFPGEHIEFDSHHRNLRAVQRGTEGYSSMKTLADMLVK